MLQNSIDLFIEAKQADGRAAATIRDYTRTLLEFRTWCQERGIGLDDLQPEHIRRYVAQLYRERSPGYAAITIRNLRVWLRWLHTEGHTTPNLAKAINAPRQHNRRELPITESEIKRLLDTCKDDTLAMRDRAIILMLYDTGVRASELAGLNLQHLFQDDGGGYVMVNAEKTNDVRIVILGNGSLAALTAYLNGRKDHKPNDPLFCDRRNQKRLGYNGIYKMLRRRAVLAGLAAERVHPHIFRKAFVTSALDAGMDAERVRVLAGWSGLEMLKVYAASDLARLRAAHKRAGPVDRMLE